MINKSAHLFNRSIRLSSRFVCNDEINQLWLKVQKQISREIITIIETNATHSFPFASKQMIFFIYSMFKNLFKCQHFFDQNNSYICFQFCEIFLCKSKVDSKQTKNDQMHYLAERPKFVILLVQNPKTVYVSDVLTNMKKNDLLISIGHQSMNK